MNFEKINAKIIKGLFFIGDVSVEGIAILNTSFGDEELQQKETECNQLDGFSWPELEKQLVLEEDKKVILVKIPTDINNMNFKGSFYRQVLAEHSNDQLKVSSIRYFVDQFSLYYLQIKFDIL